MKRVRKRNCNSNRVNAELKRLPNRQAAEEQMHHSDRAPSLKAKALLPEGF